MLSENTNVHTNYSYTYRKLYIIYILFAHIRVKNAITNTKLVIIKTLTNIFRSNFSTS